MRGKLDILDGVLDEFRITPACAGKTIVSLTFVSAQQDHPRVCGENMCGYIADHARKGSPPRVRGKLWVWFSW